MDQWKPGDEVMVKSGGPVMTVATIKSDGRVLCEWFDVKNPKSFAFTAAVLKRPDESGPPRISRG